MSTKWNKLILINNLINIAWPEFVKTQYGLIFLKAEYIANDIKNITPSEIRDKTDLESLVNHIHLCDSLKIKNFSDIVDIAKKIGEMWQYKLKIEYPDYKFRIYLTIDNDVTLRFHQIHLGEPLWLYESDWKEDIDKGKILIWNI